MPTADTAVTAEIHDCLSRFAVCVREVDYAAAWPFWHADIVIFGTHQELVRGLGAWTDTQWNDVWPRTADFAFDRGNTAVLASPDGSMAVAVTPWTSTGSQPWPGAGPVGDWTPGSSMEKRRGRTARRLPPAPALARGVDGPLRPEPWLNAWAGAFLTPRPA